MQTECPLSAISFLLSDVCDADNREADSAAKFQTVSSHRVMTEEALAILKAKKKGNYNIIKINADYKPEPIETKQVFGVTFEQGRNEFKINKELLANIVTDNKEIPESAKIDLMIALITLKVYTVQFCMLCKGRTGNRYRCGTAVQNPLYTSCRLIRQTIGSYVRIQRC